jgi:hypothetical protein
MSRDIAQRKKNLELQRQVVDALLPGGQRVEWRPALHLFALNWMKKQITRSGCRCRRATRVRSTTIHTATRFTTAATASPVQMQQSNPNQLPPVPIAELLLAGPTEAWLSALDPGLLPRILATLAEAHLKVEQDAKALPYVERLAPIQPKEAQRIGNDLLRVWATAHDPQRGMPQRRPNVIYYGPNGPYGGQGIPITRALQQRNLEELSAILQRLRRLPTPPLEDSAIVAAFTMAHSPAEVFREEAIESVLGKIEQLPTSTLGELLQTMRQRLASQWRRPQVQQQAKTQRTDVQIDAEVLRGYELLDLLIRKGLTRSPDDWRLNLVHAATSFDWAEFQYGKKVDLAIYVEKRDRAFAAFQRAAELYAATLSSLEQKDETPLVYQQWLNANLGPVISRSLRGSRNRVRTTCNGFARPFLRCQLVRRNATWMHWRRQ